MTPPYTPRAPIPATIITGFLGAGKTTLIQNLIRSAGGRRIALIVNEFGDLGFDGEQIAGCAIEGCKDEDVIELTNGCICCTVADDFLPTMEMLLARDPAPEHIVIETSGLALPQPLVQAFNWPSVAAHTTVDGVIAVADAEALALGLYAARAQRPDQKPKPMTGQGMTGQSMTGQSALDHDSPIEELFEDQLRCADLIVLSKTDRLKDAELDALGDALSAKRVGVGVVRSTMHGLPASLLIGLGAQAQADMGERHTGHHHDHDHDHDHDHEDEDDHDHHHDAFASQVITPPMFASKVDLDAYLAQLCLLPGVLRVKGVAEVRGKAAPVIVQAVGLRISSRYDTSARQQRPGLVVIGTAPLPSLEGFGQDGTQDLKAPIESAA